MKELTIREASARSGYGLEWLRDLCRSGQIRARRFGKSWAISQRSLDAYVAHPPKRGPKGPRKGAAR